MTWRCDDRKLFYEQRRLDAQQADAARKLESPKTLVRATLDDLRKETPEPGTLGLVTSDPA